MNKKRMSDKLRSAYSEEMPDLLPQIVESCSQTGQVGRKPQPAVRRRPSVLRQAAALAACLALFITGFAWGNFRQTQPVMQPSQSSVSQPSGSQPTNPPVVEVPPVVQTMVYMDVNPSIAMSFDADDRVISCTAGNEDAEIVLRQLKLEGVERNTALAAILGSMYVNGYLNENSNAVLISVDCVEADEKSGTVLVDIAEEINEVFTNSEMSCSIIAQSLECNQLLQQRAEEYGVSVGKMHLVDKLIEAVEFLEPEDAAGLTRLSVCELNLMYNSYAETDEDLFDGDVSTGLLCGFYSVEDVVDAVLKKINQLGMLEEYTTVIDYTEIEEGTWRVVYDVRMRFKYSSFFYTFRIDCRTGNVLSSDFEYAGQWSGLGKSQ